jgi:hypothetical protein
MKKLLCLFICSILFLSCSKEEATVTNAPTGQPPIDQPPLTVGNKLSFKINNPPETERLMNNIQVGEILYFSVDITDGASLPNTTYKLSTVFDPLEGIKKHQNNGTDYNFNTVEHFKEGGSASINEIVFKEKKGTFGVKILLPGSFQNVYQIQKFVDNKPVGEPVKQDLLFSAVKISAVSQNSIQRGITPASTIYVRSYVFNIDCGEQEFDNYTIISPTKKSISYESSYLGIIKSAPLANNKQSCLLKDTFVGIGEIAPFFNNINYIKVFIEYSGGIKTIIEYKNIPISDVYVP